MSGGGKSTLADLIPRFYDVTRGRITIDGIDIRDLTLQSLRAQIAVVTQFTFLFNDTVRANIAYGDARRRHGRDRGRGARRQRARVHHGAAAGLRDAGSASSASGSRAASASASRSRARILKNAPILILDEATSALDTESEGLVQEALERLMADRTTLVVAHRLSTVRRADRIVVVVARADRRERDARRAAGTRAGVPEALRAPVRRGRRRSRRCRRPRSPGAHAPRAVAAARRRECDVRDVEDGGATVVERAPA